MPPGVHLANLAKARGAQDARLTFSNSLPGGEYIALQGEDGLWTITSQDGRGIAIMGSLPAGARKNPEPIAGAWMQAVIARHRQMEAEQQHLAPVHLHHHGKGKQVRKVGYLRPKTVGKVTLDGGESDALFAEIVGVRTEDLPMLEAMEFPYRSVEVGDWESFQIESLALLSDDAPFFKLPMLKIAARHPRAEWSMVEEPGPAMAFRCIGEGAAVLFNFRGADPDQEESMKKTDADPAKKLEAEKDGEGEKGKEDGFVKEMEKLKNEILACIPEMVRSQIAAIMPPKPEEKAPAEATTYSKEVTEKMAALEGKVSALSAKDAEREKEAKLSATIEAQLSSLRGKGINVPDSVKADMRKVAESAGVQAEAALKAFANSYEAVAPRDPPSLENLRGGGLEDAQAAGEPAEVLSYAKLGADALALARQNHQHFKDLKAGRFPLQTDLKEFLAINVGPLEKAS